MSADSHKPGLEAAARRRRTTLVTLALLGVAAFAVGAGLLSDQKQLELDRTSEFSHIRVRRSGQLRSLLFVRDTGEEVVETTLDLAQPHELVSDYTKFMFLSYLFRQHPKRVLIVGLGGGAMVHFLKHYDPQVKIDVVELDPAIVEIAAEYFGVRAGDNLRILVADAAKHIHETQVRYDVVYMDAFLKPAADTDTTGVPLELKTHEFYDAIKNALAPDGLVAFNLNPQPRLWQDVKEISRNFPQTYVYRLPNGNGLVVIATLALRREPPAALAARARALDLRFAASYSFAQMAKALMPQ
jgi:spermidine synthase